MRVVGLVGLLCVAGVGCGGGGWGGGYLRISPFVRYFSA